MTISFQTYQIEITDDKTYRVGSADNDFTYDSVHLSEETRDYQTSNHAIKIFQDEKLIKSAIVCAAGGGGTFVHENSTAVKDDSLYIACSNKVFALSLPDLTLQWMTQVDIATCFGIYQADNGLFTHGEVSVTRLGTDGTIIWEMGLRDIIVTIDSDKDSFILHDDHIELEDFNKNNYKLSFDGKLIEETLSETQIRYDKIDLRQKKKWWKIW